MEDAGRWHEIDDLFAAALERAPEARAAFLAAACDGDDALRRAVEELLETATRTGDLLDGPPSLWPAATQHLALPPPADGDRVGAYRLGRVLGRGGMGTVYLAERADGTFDRQVAVKLLRPGLATDAALRRFRAERQILATLEHPHVARLYDGGVTDDGRPYLVMERVEGRPIDRYCAEEQLSVEERLRLFLDVVRAVQHAHRRLVIHRDLKPSNILVTEADPEGLATVKLLDFGLARLLEETGEDLPSAPPTQRWMTPQYASPEQVRGAPLTTASDTYQLGLILYELMTGQRPYDVEGATPGEAERLICETPPPRPSEAAATTEAPAAPAPPEALRRRLRGDLDTIILKALHKDPGRGYASAEMLADDLARHLEGLPISARPDTLAYRATKFVHRHRWGTAVAALVALLVVGYALTVTLQARRIAQERDRARLESAKAQAVTDYLVDVFAVADPSEARGDTITARELLRRGTDRLRGELRSQPEVRAALTTALGRVYRQLGLYEEAAPLLEDALQLRRAHSGTPPEDVAASLHALGVLLHERGRLDRAARLLREALARRRARADSVSPALMRTLYHLGRVHHDQQELDRAEALLREAQAAARRLGDGRLAADVRFELAMTMHDRGRYEEAFGLLQDAVGAYRALPDEPSPAYASSLHTLASFVATTGDHATADSLYREATAVRRRVYGPNHPQVAASLGARAAPLLAQGRLAEAEASVRRSLALRRAWPEDEPLHVALDLRTLGQVQRRKGATDSAEATLREVVTLQRRVHDAPSPELARSLHVLADLLRDDHRLAEAETLYREAETLYQEAYGPDNLAALRVAVGRARLLRERRDCAAAVLILEDALRQYRTLFDGPHPRIARVQAELGACQLQRGRHAEAAHHLNAAHAFYRQRAASDAQRRAVTRHLAALYEARDLPDSTAKYRALLDAYLP